jgi:hypothetical protein
MARQADFKHPRISVDRDLTALVRIYRGAVSTEPEEHPEGTVMVTRYRRTVMLRERVVDATTLAALERADGTTPDTGLERALLDLLGPP